MDTARYSHCADTLLTPHINTRIHTHTHTHTHTYTYTHDQLLVSLSVSNLLSLPGTLGGPAKVRVLSAVCYLLSAVCCLLSAVCCLLSAVCCLLSAVCCLLSAVCSLLSGICCLLSAVCTTLHQIIRLPPLRCLCMRRTMGRWVSTALRTGMSQSNNYGVTE
jgi:hypothetical protein